jgi:hypothetical protein
MEIKIGADPELFVRNEFGSLVSAYGLIPGTKAEPHKVNGGAIQVDGMALEFNIDPAASEKQFKDNINAVMGQMKAHLPVGHVFDLSPVAHFGREMIEAQPLVARELGCEPDYDAYTGEANPRPNVEAPFRTASGHIHIGWTEGMNPRDPEHFEACRMVVKQLDAVLAPLSNLWDKDKERRELYGKLGAFRPKSYGVEYRVLSNAWLKDKDTIKVVYQATLASVNALLNGARYYEFHNAVKSFNSPDPWQWAQAAANFDEYGKPSTHWYSWVEREWMKQRDEWQLKQQAERNAARAAEKVRLAARLKEAAAPGLAIADDEAIRQAWHQMWDLGLAGRPPKPKKLGL